MKYTINDPHNSNDIQWLAQGMWVRNQKHGINALLHNYFWWLLRQFELLLAYWRATKWNPRSDTFHEVVNKQKLCQNTLWFQLLQILDTKHVDRRKQLDFKKITNFPSQITLCTLCSVTRNDNLGPFHIKVHIYYHIANKKKDFPVQTCTHTHCICKMTIVDRHLLKD